MRAHLSAGCGGTGTGDAMRLNSLSGRFAALTIIFVVLAELFILLPALSTFRLDEMENRLERAQIASLAVLASDQAIASELEGELLRNAGVYNVCLLYTSDAADE